MLLASFKELLGHLNYLGLLRWEGTPQRLGNQPCVLRLRGSYREVAGSNPPRGAKVKLMSRPGVIL